MIVYLTYNGVDVCAVHTNLKHAKKLARELLEDSQDIRLVAFDTISQGLVMEIDINV